MCWSGQASAAIAIGGLSSAWFLKRRGAPKELYIPTAYFVLMEGLQAFTYTVVGQCEAPLNHLATYLAVVHISFQPFFINMLGMEFIAPDIKRRIQKYIYALCAMVALMCLARLIPAYDWLGRCAVPSPLCSIHRTCAYRGHWHIGWDVLLNGLNPRWWWYLFAAFLVPFLYGSWKWVVYHFLVGPCLAALTTPDVNERPAVWCLFSTCIIALVINSRIRGLVHVRHWFTWRTIRGRLERPREETAAL